MQELQAPNASEKKRAQYPQSINAHAAKAWLETPRTEFDMLTCAGEGAAGAIAAGGFYGMSGARRSSSLRRPPDHLGR